MLIAGEEEKIKSNQTPSENQLRAKENRCRTELKRKTFVTAPNQSTSKRLFTIINAYNTYNNAYNTFSRDDYKVHIAAGVWLEGLGFEARS